MTYDQAVARAFVNQTIPRYSEATRYHQLVSERHFIKLVDRAYPMFVFTSAVGR